MNLSALLKEYVQPTTPTSGLAGYGSNRSAAEKKRAKKKRIVDLRAWMSKGDIEGHEFHGNQWTEGGGEKAILEHLKGKELTGAQLERKFGPKVHDVLTSLIVDGKVHIALGGLRSKQTNRVARYSIVEKLHKLLTDRAAHQAATSYLNLKPQPTEAQRHAGNYPKGHVVVGGLDISIENPAGSHRRPEWPALQSHYGYIRRTEGADGDHVDCFIRQGTPEDYAGPVFVIDQKIKGAFDEHKAMVGWPTEEEARAAYLVNHDRGWDGIDEIYQMTLDGFKAWLRDGDTTRPFASSLRQQLTEKARG